MKRIVEAAVRASAIISLCTMGSAAAHSMIKITGAEITGGKLVITGKSPTGNRVSLDGKFTAKIDPATRKFRFSVAYLPLDCKATLTLIGAAAPAATAVVAKCGPTGPTRIGRRTLENTTLTLTDDTTVTLNTFRFTPPVTGEALIRGRGNCTLTADATTSTKFEIFAVEAFDEVPSSSDVAEIRVPEDQDTADHTLGWTFERTISVTEGVAKDVLINYFTIQAAVASAECVGSVTVEVINGGLPLSDVP